ncbi:hypothetical protein BaRGS_00015790, partial [Batillaria attramentaria]
MVEIRFSKSEAMFRQNVSLCRVMRRTTQSRLNNFVKKDSFGSTTEQSAISAGYSDIAV